MTILPGRMVIWELRSEAVFLSSLELRCAFVDQLLFCNGFVVEKSFSFGDHPFHQNGKYKELSARGVDALFRKIAQ